MTGPVIGVLALQGDVREHERALQASGARTVPVRRVADLSGIDGLVLPGGESTTISRLLAIFDLLGPLRESVAAGLPTYGSCAGMILLADQVLDGRADHEGVGGLDVVVRRNAFGRQVDSFESDLAFHGLGTVHAVFIRAPWVEKVGEAVQVLASVPDRPAPDLPSSDQGPAAAGRVVAVRQGSLLATSFHPELTGDGRVHGLFVQMVKEART